MLVELNRKNPLVKNGRFELFLWFEIVFQMFLDEMRTVQNTYDLIDVPFEFQLTFKNCTYIISENNSLDFYSYNLLRVSVDCVNSKTIYPFEEQLVFPTVLLKKYYLFNREIEIFFIKGVLMLLGFNINYPSCLNGKVFPETLRIESNRIVKKDIALFPQIITSYYFIFMVLLFSDNEVTIFSLNREQYCQTLTHANEYLLYQRILFNHIHFVDIMKNSEVYIKHCPYMGNDDKLYKKFDAGVCASDHSPVENRQIQIDCERVEQIKLVKFTEFSVDINALYLLDYVDIEPFESIAILIDVTTGKGYPNNRFLPEPQMVGFLFSDSGNLSKLTDTLSHQTQNGYLNNELTSVDQFIHMCLLFINVTDIICHYPLEFTIRKNFYNRTKKYIVPH